eukprot:COSAG01_NODE_16594_length_1222_cov_10.996438_3_plen_83_part_00
MVPAAAQVKLLQQRARRCAATLVLPGRPARLCVEPGLCCDTECVCAGRAATDTRPSHSRNVVRGGWRVWALLLLLLLLLLQA